MSPWPRDSHSSSPDRWAIFRYRLLPYLYSVFYEATQTGLPVQRSLAIDYSHDVKIYEPLYQNEYLFGPNLLVAPVESNRDIAKVYLPAGKWYYLYNGTAFDGNTEVLIESPLTRLPVFVKAGAIIPMTRPGQHTRERSDTMELHVYAGSDSSFCLYQDDGETFRYRHDEFYKRLSKADSPDIIFITSIMSYWYPGVQKAIELVRKIYRDTTIILGGIYATLWYEHALRNSGADIIYKGNINEDISMAFKAIGFHLKKLKAFEETVRYNDLFNYPFAPIITSKGCPFNCSYCASRILNKEFTQYPLSEIINNITNYSLKGIRDFAFYDDALLFKSDTQ